MKKSQITLCLKSNRTKNKVPELSITSRSMNYESVHSLTGTAEIVIDDVPFGVHDLTLKLTNKEGHDTVVDASGQIVEELYIVLQSLKIDQFEIIQNINHVSCYHDNQGNEITTNGFMSFPQDYQIWVQTPGWYFSRNLGVLATNGIKQYLTTSLNKF